MPHNNRYQSYSNYDYNTPRRSHYGEGRRFRSRDRDYYDDYNDFEDNTEANFSYADDDDNPIYAQPGFSGEQSWTRRGMTGGLRRNRHSDRIGKSQLGDDVDYGSGSRSFGRSRYDDSGYEDYGTRYGRGYDDSSSGKTSRSSAWGSSDRYGSSRYGSQGYGGKGQTSSATYGYSDDFDTDDDYYDEDESFGGYGNYHQGTSGRY